VNYPGTLLLVSHDRTFLNNVVTSTFVFEGNGKINEYVGGYDDWLAQKEKSTTSVATKSIEKTKPKIDFSNQKEIRSIETKITTLENKIEKLKTELADPELYETNNHAKLQTKQAEFDKLQTELNLLLAQWENLM